MSSFWQRLEKRIGNLLPDEIRDELTGVKRLLQQDRAADAKAILLALDKARPDHAPTHALLGRAERMLGNTAAAEAAVRRALALDAEDCDALVEKGILALAAGHVELAIASFRQATQSADGDRLALASAYRGLGGALYAKGDFEKCIRELRKAVAEDPNDADSRALLGHVLVEHPGAPPEEARRQLERAIRAQPPPPTAWLDLGTLELAQGNASRARECFANVLDQTAGLIGMGDADMVEERFAEADTWYQKALEREPKRADILGRSGDAWQARGDATRALERYRQALELAPTNALCERALRAALDAGETTEATRWARDLLARVPDHPLAQAAMSPGPDPAANPAGAVHHALNLLRQDPGLPRGRKLLEVARSRQFTVADPREPLPRAQMLSSILRALPGLEAEIALVDQIALDLDQALLVTVMGEFSSGKSSFVNALIGAEVAPVGATPTTGTINLVKHGREKIGRLRYQNGTIEELEWSALQKRLEAFGPEQTRAVELCELLLPLPELEYVHLVDTPGLNSMIPEHEAVARRFFARADAVVWVLSAGQAGKSTEREALRSVRDQGVRILAVMNKIDQLSPEDVKAATAYVEGEFKGLVGMVVPFSARRALEFRQKKSQDDGNLKVLDAALENHFFRRSRELKRGAAFRRLEAVASKANRLASKLKSDAQTAESQFTQAAVAVVKRQEEFQKIATTERRRLVDGMTELYRHAAREVLELVRPRNTPFGQHQATRADRDYLLSVLEDGFATLLAPSRERLTNELTAVTRASLDALGDLPPAFREDLEQEMERATQTANELLNAQVFARALAYVEGYLHGGGIDSFFRNSLGSVELTEDAVYRALYRDAPDLDAVLRDPLKTAAASAFRDLLSRLRLHARRASDRAFDLEIGVWRALDSLS
jgi:tetratricopeptide (TPR) repeat protein/GTP-binding protein EngB required for normal cell division